MNGRYRNQNLLYIFALVGVLFAIYLLYGLLTTTLQGWITLIVGVMLLVGNLPELVKTLQQRTLGTATFNTLIGLSLIAYFLGEWISKLFFYPLAIVLLLAALPLVINRAGATRAYFNTARNVGMQLRGLLRSRQRTL